LRRRIREAEAVDVEQDEPGSGAASEMASVAAIFGEPRGETGESGSEPGVSVLDLRTTRLCSGWGGLLGLIAGAVLGRGGGVAAMVAAAALGTFVGSLGAISGLALFASMVARLGAIWAVVVSLALAAMMSSLLLG
jgi:hypothetical protein